MDVEDIWFTAYQILEVNACLNAGESFGGLSPRGNGHQLQLFHADTKDIWNMSFFTGRMSDFLELHGNKTSQLLHES